MVLCIKYRKKLLSENRKIEFFKYICSELGERYQFSFDAIGTDGDHIHIFVGASPKHSPSRIMQIIKSITARELFRKYPEMKKELWGSEFWSDGGYIGTVGDGILSDIIRNYVETQGTKEEKEGFKQLSLLEFD
jgi:putative transposase